MSKRLIYAEDAIDVATLQPENWDGMYIQDLNCRIREAIEALPSAQPEIIRCKDCKHWKSNEFIGNKNNDVLTANLHSYPCKYAITDAEWFCGFAERRQDDQQ